MCLRSRLLCILAALSLFLFHSAPAAGQDAGRDAVVAGVRAAWNRYVRAFGAGDIDYIVETAYTEVSFHGTDNGIATVGRASELRAMFESVRSELGKEGYDRSETREATVCVLSDSVVIMGVKFVRYRADDSVLSEGAGTYLFTKTSRGWQIAGQIGHGEDRIMSCGAG